MTPEMQKAAADILKVLADSAQAISDGTKQQMPLLVTEYLQWSAASCVFWITLSVALLAMAWTAGAVIRHKANDGDYTDRDMVAGSWVVRLVGSAIALFVIAVNAYDLTMLHVAPRVYLMKAVLDLMRR